MIETIAVLTTICVVVLLITPSITRTAHTNETNIEPAASLRYASVGRIVIASEIISRQTTLPEDPMGDVVRMELNSRRRRVTRACETIGIKDTHLNDTLTNMIIDMEHNVSWCPIYKAASSTWMNYFAMLRGALTDATIDLMRHNRMQVSDIVKQKFRHDGDFNKIYEMLKRTKKFLIVRHPLERLLSAYRDKLERMQGREYYYKRFGRRIVLKYRQSKDSNATIKTTTTTTTTARLEPTFAEFLSFIVHERYFDEHWAPYYRTCGPCTIRYDYIFKFETLERDEDFFIRDTNLSQYLYERNYLRNVNPQGATTREILARYIKEIPPSLLDKIYDIYENDYKLFDYSFI